MEHFRASNYRCPHLGKYSWELGRLNLFGFDASCLIEHSLRMFSATNTLFVVIIKEGISSLIALLDRGSREYLPNQTVFQDYNMRKLPTSRTQSTTKGLFDILSRISWRNLIRLSIDPQ